ncbi:DUF998 domain-containing protein [Aureispira anguillae]|uniref:DUF998 domain-containing protein n=1 Tax=Aureispira anguillae TaxID=2864201 RepID=A0A916DVG6_9BACT|nr:DUF998 domain-containing protein [Aureispira anguillae]BDS13540.1 DUF998 domain-containing protein [Aureispira anguillae]
MKKIAPYAGITTCLILYSVILIAAIPYQGQQGEAYSIFNHFISELGSTRFSINHFIYNNGIIISSLGFAIFTLGLATYSASKTNKIAVVMGVCSSVLCVGVGLVPEDHRIPHLVLAVSFFSLMALSTTLFSWSIWKENNHPFPRHTAIHGFLIPFVFVLFMSMPKELMAVKREAGPLFDRPEIWWLPFLEWMIFLTLTSWILVVSVKMLQFQKIEKERQEVAFSFGELPVSNEQ